MLTKNASLGKETPGIKDQYSDQNIFEYRYQYGNNANQLAYYPSYKKEIENVLTTSLAPVSIGELEKEVKKRFKASKQEIQKVLDHLVAHTFEVAALDLRGVDTYYVWSESKLITKMTERFTIPEIKAELKNLSATKISEMAAKLTSLLTIKPSLDKIDHALDETDKMITCCKLSLAVANNAIVANRLNILKEKFRKLAILREEEYKRWAKNEAEQIKLKTNEINTETETGKYPKYPHSVLFLTGTEFSNKYKDKGMDYLTVLGYDCKDIQTMYVDIETFLPEIKRKPDFSLAMIVDDIRRMIIINPNLKIVFTNYKDHSRFEKFTSKELDLIHQLIMSAIRSGLGQIIEKEILFKLTPGK